MSREKNTQSGSKKRILGRQPAPQGYEETEKLRDEPSAEAQ